MHRAELCGLNSSWEMEGSPGKNPSLVILLTLFITPHTHILRQRCSDLRHGFSLLLKKRKESSCTGLDESEERNRGREKRRERQHVLESRCFQKLKWKGKHTPT